MNTASALRERLAKNEILLLPGAADALTARLVEEGGFDAVYATGAGFANASFGLPDIGLISSKEVFDHVGRMADAVAIPLIVDADTGYGDLLQVRRTIRELDRAGAAAIQLEDQVTSKRCGHFDGQRLIPEEDMVQKIRIAIDSRRNSDLVIIARTDARNVEGFDAAVHRARAYVEAGADLIFVEAPRSREEMQQLPELVGHPLMANMVEGGKTPMLSTAELQEAGYKIALFANAAMRASMFAVREVLEVLKRDGSSDAYADRIMSWEDRQRLVRLEEFQATENAYTSSTNSSTPKA